MTTPRPVPTQEDTLAGYGFVGLLAKAIPELNTILQQAIQGQWAPDRFVQTVADSNWYKSTSATQRDWITKQLTDPATAQMEANTGADSIRNLTAQLGVPMPSNEKALEIWLWTRFAGYNENDTRAYVARAAFDEGGWQEEGGGGGVYGRLVNDMFKLAADYGYSSPDITGEILDKAQWIMRTGGAVDTTGWASKMIDYASAYYAPFKEEIRGGKTVAELSKPVVDRVAQLLEMNPANVSVTDPLVKKALTEWNPEGRAYSLREIEDATRRDARWKVTDNAKLSAVQMAEEIANKFGLIPGSAGGR
jgi:hypothetical protein